MTKQLVCITCARCCSVAEVNQDIQCNDCTSAEMDIRLMMTQTGEVVGARMKGGLNSTWL